ncbi:MAG: hypothetical protein J6M60_06680 [Clostridia bacterium]|nr:hypothetical protein [Clostridia bacterium]
MFYLIYLQLVKALGSVAAARESIILVVVSLLCFKVALSYFGKSLGIKPKPLDAGRTLKVGRNILSKFGKMLWKLLKFLWKVVKAFNKKVYTFFVAKGASVGTARLVSFLLTAVLVILII